jgi:hypothetical protein
MGYRAGNTVIVTQGDTHRVGVVLDKHIVSKQTVYDILLENRSAVVYVGTSQSNQTYINKTLTEKLVDSGAIECTIPYKDLVAEEALPICHA